MAAMEQCRTAALGGHGSQWTACGDLEYRSYACKHRPCPQCHHAEATRWLAQPRTLLLPVPSLLVTFPLPEAVREVTRTQQTTLYTMLHRISTGKGRLPVGEAV
jgi:hypothetical protein